MRGGILGRGLGLTIVEQLGRSARIRSLQSVPFPHKLISMRGTSTGQNPVMQPLQLKRQVRPIRHHVKHLGARARFYHALPD